MQTMTISEVAAATGLSKKAVRTRVDRGQLRAVLKDGLRRIPLTELQRAGLYGADGQPLEAPRRGDERHLPHEAASLEATVRDLLDRLQAAHVELGQLRAITQEAESLRLRESQERERAERLQAEVHELRAKVQELEQRRRPFLRLRRRAA